MSGIAYCEPHQLASWLRGPEKPGLVILDVRDDDFEDGGHIPGAINAPSYTLSNGSAFDALIDGPLASAQRIVVHCMLSQQRGPRAALQLTARYEARGLPSPALLVLRGGFRRFFATYSAEKDLVQHTPASS